VRAQSPSRWSNVDQATYLIGSKLPGVMTAKSKKAFASKEAAAAAQKEHGGELGDFSAALAAAHASMVDDTMMIGRSARETRKGGGRQELRNVGRVSATPLPDLHHRRPTPCQPAPLPTHAGALRFMTRLLAVALVCALVLPALCAVAECPDPGDRDTCPVCGMFVARYPEWVATVVYRDGHAHHFGRREGPLQVPARPRPLAPGHRADDIATIAVTDYYAVQRVDARSAWYVIGSDMLGPMGTS